MEGSTATVDQYLLRKSELTNAVSGRRRGQVVNDADVGAHSSDSLALLMQRNPW